MSSQRCQTARVTSTAPARRARPIADRTGSILQTAGRALSPTSRRAPPSVYMGEIDPRHARLGERGGNTDKNACGNTVDLAVYDGSACWENLIWSETPPDEQPCPL